MVIQILLYGYAIPGKCIEKLHQQKKIIFLIERLREFFSPTKEKINSVGSSTFQEGIQ